MATKFGNKITTSLLTLKENIRALGPKSKVEIPRTGRVRQWEQGWAKADPRGTSVHTTSSQHTEQSTQLRKESLIVPCHIF